MKSTRAAPGANNFTTTRARAMSKAVDDLAAKPGSSPTSVQTMIAILKDEKLDDDDKKFLIDRARNSFRVRRRMAYVCLAGIFVLSVFDALPYFDVDLAWANGPLAAVVLAYYGATAFRPNS